MYLNTLQPAMGSKKNPRRVGRGIGSGLGKTCGKGHKGQKSRSGGFHKVGFEGGQMPYHMRLPKFGFTSRKAMVRAEVRLDALKKLKDEIVDLASLIKANLVAPGTKFVKIIASGKLHGAITVRGVGVTKGASKIIQAAGGKIE